jgi:hypothetical protein
MTYKINKTDGSLLTEIIDSAIDTTATDLALIGKNVTGYGEYLNENFIKLLENFASTSEPNNPITGQIWFDVSENRLKVYDGNGFRIGSGPIVSGTAPLNPIQGDFWIDSAENQLYFYDGTDRQLAGPIYKDSQGISGWEVATIADIDGNSKVIVKLWAAQSLLGIFSKYTEFTPSSLIPGYAGSIKTGFNAGTVSGFKLNATASSADALVDSFGNLKTVSSFMLTDDDNSTTGSLTIINPEPLILGANQENTILVSDDDIRIRSNFGGNIAHPDGQNFIITTKQGSTFSDAITVKAATNRVGIFNNAPTGMLHIGTTLAPGNVVIEGNLTVNGTSTSINSTVVAIDDINIVLGDTASPTDVTANGGGLTLKGTSDKTLSWIDATDSWTSNQNFDITFGKTYKINGVDVLTATTLGSSIVNSSLTSIGTLTSLQVDNININGNTISSTTGNITLSPVGSGVVDVATSRITSLSDPVAATDAVNLQTLTASLPAPWINVNANYQSSKNDRLLVSTISGTLTVTLPNVVSSSDTIRFFDYDSTFDTDNLIIARYRRIDPTTIAGLSAGVATTFIGLATTTTSVAGSGIIVTVATTSATPAGYNNVNTTITVTTSGYGYVTGDVITVSGADIGGTSPANDLIFELDVMDNIFGLDQDLVVNDATASFGLIYANVGQGWRYLEVLELPPVVNADLMGNVTGNLTGNVTGNVSGNLTGSVLTAVQSNITSLGTLSSLTVSSNILANLKGNLVSSNTNLTVLDTSAVTATFAGNVTGDLTGDVTGDISNTQLVLESTTNSVLIKSGDNGIRLSSRISGPGSEEQTNIEITPGGGIGQRPSTILYGNVEVANISSAGVFGSSFKIPTYTGLELAARSLSALNYGELIYNSDANQIQAYISPGSWVSLN